MHRIPAPAIALALLLAAAPAHALSFWGTGAKTDTWVCPSFCTDVARGPSDGGEFQSTADSVIDDSRGRAEVHVSLDPTTGIATPTLAAGAFSKGGTGSAHTQAFAVEGYTNVSGSTQSYTLDITLEADVFMPSSDTFVEVELVAYREQDFYFTTDRATLELEIGATFFEETTLRIQSELVTQVQGSLTFELAPGESVYIWALLVAEAERDSAYADALGTVTASFQDSAGLVAASSLPEPALGWLLAAAGAAAARRKRTRA